MSSPPPPPSPPPPFRDPFATQETADSRRDTVKQEVTPVPDVLVGASVRFDWIWLLPSLAVVIAVWLGYETLMTQGPLISITFQTANGLTAGKTRIKHKAVEIGQVKEIDLNDDFSGVVVRARIKKSAEPYLRSSTQFWVVRPRLGMKGISGLDTLVSGAYIELEPGTGPRMRAFAGLETAPMVRMNAPGKKYVLQTASLGSLEVGSPLYYRGLPAGEVLGYTLAKDGKNVQVHLFVQAPYHTMVQNDTRFWKISGIDFSLDAGGIDVKTHSLQALWMGGIAFDSPETLKPVTTTGHDMLFWLYENEAAIAEQAYTRKILFVLYFDASVRGLQVGAPVEFRGIKLGKVTDIRMAYYATNATFRVPVLIQIEPERINVIEGGAQPDTEEAAYALMDALVKRGLRAQLQTSSYLTGQRFVNLDMIPDAPFSLSGFDDKFPELPTTAGTIGEITTSVARLLKTLQSLPLKEMAEELHGAFQGANRMIHAPEILATVQAMGKASTTLVTVLEQVDRQLLVMSDRVGGVTEAAKGALVQTEQALTTVESVIHPDAPLHHNLMEATEELAHAARAIRSFIELLEKRPESLLFGK